MDRPTEPIPPASGGWRLEPPGGWGARPPAGQPPGGRHRGGVKDGCSGGRLLARRFRGERHSGGAPVRAVTVTSIVTSLVPAPTTRRPAADHYVGAGDSEGRRGRRRRPGGRGPARLPPAGPDRLPPGRRATAARPTRTSVSPHRHQTWTAQISASRTSPSKGSTRTDSMPTTTEWAAKASQADCPYAGC